MLTAIITLSTASVYYAQAVKDTTSKSKDIEEVVLTGVADIAKDRKTPVAVSTIKEAQIVERLGNQEFPEILNTTPSVYATKGGGGFGDSRINIRGFDQRNVAVMINGVPVNDMENGQVYWSNWAGLSDVTSAMQVQRGLGSSKLAIASVGGTINVLTRAADKKRGGTLSASIGNNDYHKALFSYNTGKSDKGWSSSFLMSRTAGSMYADGTEFEGYNYYFAVGFEPSKKHDFQFTITGAPQWHHQRSFSPTIQEYLRYGKDGEPNRRYNLNWGMLNGNEYSFARNFYHKPVTSLNWDWKISSATKLSTVVYASFGRGGGTGTLGRVNNNTENGFRNAEGYIDFDAIYAANAAIPTPNSNSANSVFIRRASINSHNWIGGISSLNHKFNDKLSLTAGIDARFYKGLHYRVVSDFLGAKYIIDNADKNNPNRTLFNSYDSNPTWNPFGGNPTQEKIVYNNDGLVKWLGGFAQLEYTNDKISAFVQGSVSNQGYKRIDYFVLDGANGLPRETDYNNMTGFNVKSGLNYNINENHNVFGNIGYYERQPFFQSVYLNDTNRLNPNLTNEKIFSVELGYGFRSSNFNANVNLYRTVWSDIYKRGTFREVANNVTTVYNFNVFGVEEIHQGVEVDASYKIGSILTLNGMFSVGDWYYTKDTTGFKINDETNTILGEVPIYLKDSKVGDAAQLTTSIGADINITKWLNFDTDFRYADKLYSAFNPESSTKLSTSSPIRLPGYGLLDLGVTLKYKLNDKQGFMLRVNVNNVLDRTYIAEARTNTPTNLTQNDFVNNNGTPNTNAYNNYLSQGTYRGIHQSNQVYFGFGRTWNTTLTFNF